MQHAIATATTFASGLQQAFRSDAMTKALHAGHAAAVGIRSGMAAACGVTGVPDILEGEVGFGAALADKPDWRLATEGLGHDYNITHITQKTQGSDDTHLPASHPPTKLPNPMPPNQRQHQQ